MMNRTFGCLGLAPGEEEPFAVAVKRLPAALFGKGRMESISGAMTT